MRIPTIDELRFYALKIGLPEEQAEMFEDYYESNGWKVGRVAMKSWQAAMRNWRRNWEARNRPAKGSNGTASVWELRSVLEAKQQEAQRLKNRHAMETPMGLSWEDNVVRGEYTKLQREIREVQTKIANYGL